MRKNISFASRLFLEDLTTKYELENFLLQGDSEFSKYFSAASTSVEKIAVKFMFLPAIKECFTKQIPLAEILPSEKLTVIVTELINQEIEYNDLPEAIKKEIGVSDEIALQISQEIANNKKIAEDRSALFIKEDFESDEIGGINEVGEHPAPQKISASEKVSGLSQELQ
ncbi:MAG: hypothetical protein WC470_01800 [Candidatus Paceibacterota bacterium]